MKLAINGGTPIREDFFPAQITTGKEELEAVTRVMKNGKLSGYRGSWNDAFWGGDEIKALEREWCDYFNVKYAIPCNSATSGLQIACGAIGLGPGDEVIVTPWSMSCSATAPLLFRAAPVFADIDPNNYCLSLESIKNKITSNTKAIIIVDLFGQGYNAFEWKVLQSICYNRKNKIYIIEDAAQAIGGYTKDINKNKYYGTLGDIGVYSFNYGKHITCGEGGMIVTDSNDLSHNCRLLMNHSEAVLHDYYKSSTELNFESNGKCIKKDYFYSATKHLVHQPGFNMRMTEINAAIIREQLRKLKNLVKWKRFNVQYLEHLLEPLIDMNILSIKKNNTYHSYYVHSMEYNSENCKGIHRDIFINAVKAELKPLANRDSEGIPMGAGYIAPLYKMPIFNNKAMYKNEYLPIVEDLQNNKLFLHRFISCPTTQKDINDVADAFLKVYENKDELL